MARKEQGIFFIICLCRITISCWHKLLSYQRFWQTWFL